MIAGRTMLSRVAWMLPPFALCCAAVRWPSLTIPFIYVANFFGYIEPRPGD